MSEKTLSVVIRLRRDNDYNYETIKDTFIPAGGEVCLVDTVKYGLRAKVGDGVKTYAQLPFTDEGLRNELASIIRGYYYNGQFYEEASHTTLIIASIYKIYIDKINSKLYFYDGSQYIVVSGTTSLATDTEPGILKLYSNKGQNTDGTMTQKAISDLLDTKIEAEADVTTETLLLHN